MGIKYAFILPHPPILVPGIGKGEENKARKTIEGFEEIGKIIGEIKPETIIISSPHSAIYSDYINISTGKKAKGDFGNFRAGNIKIEVEYDEDIVEKIIKKAKEIKIPAGNLGIQGDELDHGVMVPLYYINKYYKDYKLVRMGISGLPLKTHYELGKVIQNIAENEQKNIVYIASGDLSHKLLEEGPYGFAKEGPVFDKEIGEAIENGDFLKFFQFTPDFLEDAAECGLRSFVIMAGVLDSKKIESKLLSLEGPFGVGYATGYFKVVGEDNSRKFHILYDDYEKKKLKEIKEKEDSWVQLARHSLEYYIKNKKKSTVPKDLPEELTNTRAGAFVTLYKNGQLRGCIGTIEPTKNTLAEEIIDNAISSGTRDSRFPVVKEDELKDLVYSVDVLLPAEKIYSKDLLDPKKYGVIVTSGGKRGLLLPNIAGVNDIEYQLKIARQKAGINEYEDYEIERFEVVRHQ